MTEWIRAHETLLWWLAIGSLITFVVTLVVVPIMVIRLPDDYFLPARRHVSRWRKLRPVPGITLLVLKNVLGAVFIVAGMAMLVLPGQGILTIVVGVMLLNFPGKYRLERRLARARPVARSINWIRAKAGRGPLRVEC